MHTIMYFQVNYDITLRILKSFMRVENICKNDVIDNYLI